MSELQNRLDLIERLEADNARLRAQLVKVAPAVIRGGFDLSSETLARMIWRMHRARPDAWVPLHDLELEVEAAGGMPNENTVRVYVGRIRKALGFDFILNEHGAGYRLSEAARRRVAELMGD